MLSTTALSSEAEKHRDTCARDAVALASTFGDSQSWHLLDYDAPTMALELSRQRQIMKNQR